MSLNIIRLATLINITECNYRQPEKKIEYQTLVLNLRPFGNALAVSYFRRSARLRLCAYDFHCSIQKRPDKLGRNISFNESHVLYCDFHSITKNASSLLKCLNAQNLLDLRQYKNNSMESTSKFVLKMPRFFTRLCGEGKIAAISKLTYI